MYREMMEGKVAIVTGAANGIGRATSLAFAEEGVKVVAADRDAAHLEETVQMIKDMGGEAVSIVTDVSKEEDIKAMVKLAVDTFGRLDYAVNNAGIDGKSETNVADLDIEDWDPVIAVDLRSVFMGMKYEIPEMMKNGGGAIVNTSSICGLAGIPGSCAYNSAKWGIVGLTKTAACEYAQAGIRINAICPGTTMTPQMEKIIAEHEHVDAYIQLCPMKRFGKAEEQAAAVLWLCSDAASFVTGVALPVDGGFMAGS